MPPKRITLITCSLVLGFLVSSPSALDFVYLHFHWVVFGVSLHLLPIEGFPPSQCESLNGAAGLVWVLEDKV